MDKKLLVVLGIFFLYICGFSSELDFEDMGSLKETSIFKHRIFKENCVITDDLEAFDCKFKGDITFYGNSNIKNCTFYSNCVITNDLEAFDCKFKGDITFYGNSSIKNCTFYNNCVITNDLEAFDCKFKGDIIFYGSSNIKNCTFYNNCLITNDLEVLDSFFRGNLSLNGEKFSFSNCEVESIHIDPPTPMKTQVVVLKSGTVVNKSIFFKKGRGKVVLSKDSKIKGKVVGGEIFNKLR